EYQSPQYQGIDFGAVVEVPMQAGGELIGVLGVTELGDSQRRYTEDDARLLALFAGQAAGAVRSIRLLQETRIRAQQLALLYDAGLTLNSVLEPRAQLEFLFKIAMRALHADRAEFFRYDPAHQQVTLELGVGYSPEALRVLSNRRFSVTREEGFHGWVFQHRVPLNIPDLLTDPRYMRVDDSLRSGLWTPVEHEGQIQGILAILSTRPAAFSIQDERLLVLFANQAAIALENARLYTATRQELAERNRVELALRDKIRTLQTLAEIDRQVMAISELPALMDLFCARTADLLHVPKVVVTILNGERIQILATRGLIAPELVIPEFIRTEQQILGDRFIHPHQNITVAEKVTDDEPRMAQFRRREGIQALARSTLLAGNRTMGHLLVFDTKPRPWSADDLELLSLLAGQAAIAIEKTRLLNELEQSLATTTRLYQLSGQVLVAATFEETARLTTRILREGLAADMASIRLLDAQGQTIFNYGIGYPEGFPHREQPRAEGVTMEAWRTGQILIIDEPARLNPHLQALGVQCGVALPLPGEDEVLGILSVNYMQAHSFSEREVQLLRLFANQTALALRNVRLLEETRRRADQFTVINRIASAVSRSRHLDGMLETIYREVQGAFAIDGFLIALYDEETDELDFRIRVDEQGHLPAERMPKDAAPLCSYTLTKRKAFIVDDLQAQGQDYPLPVIVGSPRAPRSWLGAPMQFGTKVIGILSLQAYAPHAYSEDDRRLLETIADQAAVGIENARLYEETRQRLAELEAINKISTVVRVTASSEEMLQHILDETLTALDATTGLMAFDDAGAQALHVGAARGWFNQVPRTLARGQGLLGRVLSSGEAVITREFNPEIPMAEPGRPVIPGGWGGAILPIRAAEAIVGVLALATPLPREIAPHEIRLLRTVSEITGSAVHRTRLHESLETAYLETVLALANAIEERDNYTQDHSRRLADIALALARAVGLSTEEQETIRLAAHLHDIGKIGVPDAILLKPAILEPHEWQVMKRHPATGAGIIQPVQRLRDVIPLILHHQERYDGSGYPDGLAGEAIPLGARILNLANSVSAMLDHRHYREERTWEQVRDEVQRCAGTQFDPHLIEVLLRIENQIRAK
ncbi:MAG: GAF domain-containing protein, partial [Anaerolineae bacterium]